MDNVHIIVSPPCANKHGGRFYRPMIEAVRSVLGTHQLHLTERAGQATELARRAIRDGAGLVIAGGGDGTISEVINGMVGGQSPLAILPIGRGNDYYRSLLAEKGETFDLTPAAVSRRIGQGTPRPVDVGQVRYKDSNGQEGTRYFLVNATLGFSAAVTRSVSRTRWAGAATYILGVLTNLLMWRNQEAEVTVDDHAFKGRVFNLNIALAKYYGTAMVASPKALVGDGLMDVVWMQDLSIFDVIRYMPNNYSGDFDSVPKIKQYTGRKVRIEAPAPLTIQVDGDCIGSTPVWIELLPAALQVLV